VKLPLEEEGHEALRRELAEWDGYVSSALLEVEAVRACAHYGEEFEQDARAWLEGVALLPLDDAVLAKAAALSPDSLRSLDALHLATALGVREEIGVFVTYDERLAAAAKEHGLSAVRPS
jgi:uncharacterized protein